MKMIPFCLPNCHCSGVNTEVTEEMQSTQLSFNHQQALELKDEMLIMPVTPSIVHHTVFDKLSLIYLQPWPGNSI